MFMEGGKILRLHSQQMLNTWSIAESTAIVGALSLSESSFRIDCSFASFLREPT
jgi:hypothetical protein